MPVFGPGVRPEFWFKAEAFERPFGGVDLSADQGKARNSMLDIEHLPDSRFDDGGWSAMEVATEEGGDGKRTFALHL